MNRKQNILLFYFAIALSYLLIFGYLNNDLPKFNFTTISIVVLAILCVVSIITTKGEESIDVKIFNRQILPVILIPIYTAIAFFSIAYFVENLNFSKLTDKQIGEFNARGSLDNNKFEFSYDTKNFKLKSAKVKLTDSNWNKEEITEIVSLQCSYNCTGNRFNKEIREITEWSIMEAYGKSQNTASLFIVAGLLIIYMPIGMIVVFLTSARDHLDKKFSDEVAFFKRFLFFSITYLIGIVFFPLFLNSWFTRKSSKSVSRNILDEFNTIVNSSANTAGNFNFYIAVNSAYLDLLGEVVSKADVMDKAEELSKSNIYFSTNDLSLVTALHFFKKAELNDSLSDVQLLARLKLQKWIHEKSVNPIIAKSFEDTLYLNFKI